MKVKINLDNSVQVVSTQEETEFSKRLAEKYPTPNADKLLSTNSNINNFDEHKFYN